MGVPDPAVAPVTPDCTIAHMNVVPVTFDVNEMLVVSLLQIVSDVGLAVTTGFGLTVMTISTIPPKQVLAEGVTVYVAICVVETVFVNACAIVLPIPSLAPVIFGALTVHEKVVPETLDPSVINGANPLQIVCDEGVAVNIGNGFTVTNMFEAIPRHPSASGVIVYVTVPAFVPEFVSVCAIIFPLSAIAPDTPLCDIVQENVVPVTFEFKLIFVVSPLQIVCAEAITFGVGLTVTITSTMVPEQEAANGVI